MMLVAAYEEYNKNMGVYSVRNAYIDRIHKIATESSNAKIRQSAASSLIHAMILGGFPRFYAGTTAISEAAMGNQTKELQETNSKDAISLASLLNSFRLRKTFQCTTSDRAFAVCNSYLSCNEALNDLQPAMVYDAHFEKDNSDSVRKLLAELEADVECLPTRMRTELLKYKLKSTKVWYNFYQVTNYSQLEVKDAGKTPAVNNHNKIKPQQVFADLQELIAEGERDFFSHRNPMFVDTFSMYRFYREQLMDYAFAKELSYAELITKPLAQQEADVKAHVTENLEALNAHAGETYAENISHFFLLKRAMQATKSGSPDPSLFLAEITNLVSAWKSAQKSKQTPESLQALHPVIATKILTQYINEYKLPWRAKWYKTAAKIIQDVPEGDLSNFATNKLNALRYILQSIKQRRPRRCCSTIQGCRKPDLNGLFDKERDIAVNDSSFHSFTHQAVTAHRTTSRHDQSSRRI